MRIRAAAQSLVGRVDYLTDHGVVVPVLLAEEVEQLRRSLDRPVHLSIDGAAALLELAQLSDPSDRTPEEQAVIDYLAEALSAEQA